MQKRKFRIGDLAQKLKVDKFVIRFWEKEFALNSGRSDGGQRFYEEKDLDTFMQIKTLLYDKKFTIAGAKKQLKDLSIEPNKDLNFNTSNNIIASQKTNIPGIPQETQDFGHKNTKLNQIGFSKLDTKILKKIVNLKQNLVKLRDLLN